MEEVQLLGPVKCGFDKWSMCIDLKNGCVKIVADHYPNITELSMYDGCAKDYRKLADIFTMAAIELEKTENLEKTSG